MADTAAVTVVASAASGFDEEEEEEEMTPYSSRDLTEGWEFKILRNSTGRFRNPALLRATLEEESRAGWELVEKFDDRRVRLKRRVSARQNDAGLGFDPYRTRIQSREEWTIAAVSIMALIVCTGAVISILVYLSTTR